MDWKKKLMLATGAFASMPAAVTAHPELINGKRRRRRTGTLIRRTVSVPFTFDPKVDQSIRANVRVPINKARRRVYGQSISRCNSYRVNASLIKIDGAFIKIESSQITAGGGTTIEFDMTDVLEPTAVIAKVEVTPTDVENCISTSPLTSFTLKGTGGRDFLPTRDLDPVLRKIFPTGPIIIK